MTSAPIACPTCGTIPAESKRYIGTLSVWHLFRCPKCAVVQEVWEARKSEGAAAPLKKEEAQPLRSKLLEEGEL